MVVIRVNVEVGAANRAAFLESSLAEVAQVRSLEGCLNYGWYERTHQTGSFLLYQEWATPADFEAFRSSAFFEQNGKKIFPMLSGKPDTAYFDAQALPTA